ncbi:MAG: plasmid mobilization protein [Myxococcales bacterium]
MPTITFKVTPEEAARIRRQARREGRTVSEMLRARAAQPLASAKSDRTAGYRMEKSPVTGLPVMVAPPGTPEVSAEQVRSLLTDFP